MPGIHLNGGILIAVADGISKHIIEHSLQLVGIAGQHHVRLNIKFAFQIFLGQHRLKLMPQLFQHHRQIDFAVHKRDV